MILAEAKKQMKEKSVAKPKKHKVTVKTKLKTAIDVNSEAAKKIKEAFRSNMAGVMVGILNPYRRPDCMEGRITNTDDFKHLARKVCFLTFLENFVLLPLFNAAHSLRHAERDQALR